MAGLGGAIGAGLTTAMMAMTGAFSPDVVERTVIREEAVPVEVEAGDMHPAMAVADGALHSVARIESTFADTVTTGSAIVFDRQGHLVTNAHVIVDATTIIVVLAGERRVTAEVVGTDLATDLAVLSIPNGGTLTPVEPRADRPAIVGEPAIAIGSPLSLTGGPSVSTGIVSAHRSRVETGEASVLYGLIQTDATIAAGSSGGALFDAEGLLLGLTTAVASDEEASGGISFAIPAGQVTRVATELIDVGYVTHAWMGVEGERGTSRPARVVSVAAAGPADLAGLTQGDVITEIDGESTPTMADVVLQLRSHFPGEAVDLEYVRDGELEECRVVLAAHP